VFFASEETGIQWVLGIGSKRYVPTNIRKIHKKLDALLEVQAEQVKTQIN
jgi:hypothetical protein